MQLNDFIQAYLTSSARLERDFTGARGWINLTNLVLKRYESYGWFSLDRRKEVGVEVNNSYWITIPSDMRQAEQIFCPPLSHYSQSDRKFQYEIVNGKIKMKTPFDKKADPETFVLSGWSADSVLISDVDAEESEYKDWLLVVTDGNLSGKNILIADNQESSGVETELSFYHSVGSLAATSAAGYMTDQYLMFRYMAKFTGMTSHTEEIPINDTFEYVLAQSLLVESMSKSDKSFKIQWDLEQKMIDDINCELFTPDEGTRIRPRKLPGLDGSINTRPDDFEYIGDGEDE